MRDPGRRRLLVTGATGMVGRAVCVAGQSSGWMVRALTRRAAALPVGIAVDLLSDWGDAPALRQSLQDCDVVVHCAGRAHVMADTARVPLDAYRSVNVDISLALARQSALAGVRRFVFISSVKVNGESTLPGTAFTEADAVAPVDPYAISKWEAEQGLAQIGLQTGMEIVIIRPPLVYGPGVKANFATMVQCLRRKVPLPLAGVTDNRRSYVALDNLSDFVRTCLDHPAAANETFLISDGHDLSTAELLLRLGQVMKKPARLFFVPLPLLHMGARILGRATMARRLCDSLQVNITKAQDRLGWEPLVSVNEGLGRVVHAQGTAS